MSHIRYVIFPGFLLVMVLCNVATEWANAELGENVITSRVERVNNIFIRDPSYGKRIKFIGERLSSEKWLQSTKVVDPKLDIEGILRGVIGTNTPLEKRPGLNGGQTRLSWHDDKFPVLPDAPLLPPRHSDQREYLFFGVYQDGESAQWALLNTLLGQGAYEAKVKISPTNFPDTILVERGTTVDLVYYNVYIRFAFMSRQGFGDNPPKEDVIYAREVLQKIWQEVRKLPLVKVDVKDRKIADISKTIPSPLTVKEGVGKIHILGDSKYSKYKWDITVQPDVVVSDVVYGVGGEIIIEIRPKKKGRVHIGITGAGPKGEIIEDILSVDVVD